MSGNITVRCTMEYTETINGANIKDWNSFHIEFQEKMGFIEGYGRNTNAWIDCMTDIFTNGDYKSLTKYNLNEGDKFILRIVNAEKWKEQNTDIFNAFIEFCIWSNNEKTNFYLELL